MSDEKSFVHLHVHTEFSLLDGLSQINRLVKRAAELDMPALAITDHGTMFGVIDFYRACKEAGIRPVIGLEAYLTARGRTRFDHEAHIDTRPYHLLLLAQNQTGYQNLLRIASEAQLNGYYYRPRIDHDFLAKHAEGLIATSGCLAAEIPRLFEQGREREALESIGWYQDVFGPDNFFLELQHHKIEQLHAFNHWLMTHQNYAQVPLLATNDVHYVLASDYDAHDTLLCIQTSNVKSEQNRLRFTSDTFHLRSPAEMWDLFGQAAPEALTNSLQIAERCSVDLESKGYHLPVFPVPEGYTAETYLRSLCERGLVWRYGERAGDPTVVNRLNHELNIIHSMGFDTYFLIVWDLCEFARYADIWWNVRGSGAGSVAAYCLGITNIDPLSNSLIFERFLNPGRVSMPDIDLDYPEDRRAEMIEYCARKYGEDKVAAIITFGTLGSKAAIRDVGRALSMPLTEVDRVARMIPSGGKPIKFKDALGEDPEKALPELKQAYATDPLAKRLIDEARQLEGLTRHASTHAAGIIVADKPLVEYIPLHRPTKGSAEDAPVKMVTQFPMETCESIGLLKVDFLGLSTLTIMRKACDLIERYHGIPYDLSNIPYLRDPDDPKTSRMIDEMFAMLGRGETIGVFQLESQGMRRMLIDMRPTRFEHIVAGISLYRPGPMDYIPLYNKRLHGEEEVIYKHDKLKSILSETYGVIVYQEQIMQIAAELFGYELGEADLMRRAVSKKKEKDLLKHKQIFMERGPEHGVDAESAAAIFEDIAFFARYGFNKCLSGDTQIIDASTGHLVNVRDLAEGCASIEHTLTCDTASLRLHSGPVTDVIENGVKPLYRLRTALGREITGTANHPFYTFEGWRLLGELALGDPIATPRRLPIEGTRVWPEERIVSLIRNLKSDCDLPAEVFTLINDQQARIISGLGEAHNAFLTHSERLARQVAHLLLRQGVLSELSQQPDGQWRLARLEPIPSGVISQGATSSVQTNDETSDIYWDRIVSIDYVGEDMTYDLTVPDTHNFVANDIIVHNSHAADYAVLTCQTAFLKCHYPHEYMAALMSVHRDDSAKVSLFAADCHRMGIEVLAPNINTSSLDFTIEQRPGGTRGIRFGMAAVKNVGVGPVEHILERREQGGPFRDIDDFCQRVDLRLVQKRALESLIRVGALDDFGPRHVLLATLDQMLKFSADHHKAKEIGQMSLFGDTTGIDMGISQSIRAIAPTVDPVPKREMLNWEKELVGLYVTDHPLRELASQIAAAATISTSADLIEAGDTIQDKPVSIVGLVTDIRTIVTKRGDTMAILTIEDITGSLSAVLFPRTWETYKSIVAADAILRLNGKADASRGDMQIIVDDITTNLALVMDADAPPLALQEQRFSWIEDDESSEGSSHEPAVRPSAAAARSASAWLTTVAEAVNGNDTYEDEEPDEDEEDDGMGERISTLPADVPLSDEAIIPASGGASVAADAPPIEPPALPAEPDFGPPRDEPPGWLDEDMSHHTTFSSEPVRHPAEEGQPAAPQDAPVINAAGRLTPPPAPAARPRRDFAERDSEPEAGESSAPDAHERHIRSTPSPRRQPAAPEPPPGRLLTLTIPRTGDSARDRKRLQRLHGFVIQYPGHDHFRFVIPREGDPKPAVMVFPNHPIDINDTMLDWLIKTLGEENVRVD